MNLSITNATIGEIKALLGLFSSNLQFTLDDEVEKLISKDVNTEPKVVTVNPTVEANKEIINEVLDTAAEKLQNAFEDFSLLEDDPDFTEIKPVSGSEDNLEQLHLDAVPVQEEKTYTKVDLHRLAEKFCNTGTAETKAKNIKDFRSLLEEYKVQALPQLDEKDFNSFGVKLEAYLKGIA